MIKRNQISLDCLASVKQHWLMFCVFPSKQHFSSVATSTTVFLHKRTTTQHTVLRLRNTFTRFRGSTISWNSYHFQNCTLCTWGLSGSHILRTYVLGLQGCEAISGWGFCSSWCTGWNCAMFSQCASSLKLTCLNKCILLMGLTAAKMMPSLHRKTLHTVEALSGLSQMVHTCILIQLVISYENA